MIAVQRVAAPAEIIIQTLRGKHVINPVVEALKRKEGSLFISFCSMVKNHIKNHFNAIGIQLPNQPLQFITFPVKLFLCSIAGVRCKKANRIISPVIQKHPAVNLTPSHRLIKLKYRHKLHCGDSQILKVWNFFPDPRKGSRMFNSGRGILRKSPDMKLIDNQILNRSDRIHMIPPVKIIDHYSGPVPMILIRLFSPYALSGNCSCIGIQKWLCFVINKTLFRSIWTIHPVSVLKIINIQSKNDHGIDTTDPVMLRKR